MLGDFAGHARGVVGHEQRADPDGGQGLHGTLRRLLTAEDGAVEIEEQAVVLLRKGRHVRKAP